MSIELKITDRTDVKFPIIIKDTNGNEIYKQYENGIWVERTFDDNNNELTWKDSNGCHYIKGEYATKEKFEAFINNMSNKQSSIDFLLTELDIPKLISREKLIIAAEVVRQAKEMHKQEIIKAYYGESYSTRNEEQYYNEHFGK